MSLTIYDISVPVFRQTLRALIGLLKKAQAHCDAEGVDPRILIDARLAPDMQPFAFQLAAVLNNSIGALARLRGAPVERAESLETLAAMIEALADALADLEAVAPSDLEGAESREIVLPNPKGARHFNGRAYLLTLALPNFFFHATTVYDILRAQGLNIGKRDFLGELPPRRPIPEVATA